MAPCSSWLATGTSRLPLKNRFSDTAATAVRRMPDSSSGCRLCDICWAQRGATSGIRPKPIDSATM